MSQQLELLTENMSQWVPVSFITPEITIKEIKPFVVLALKELEGNPDSRTSSLTNVHKFAAVRSIVRHVSRLQSATEEPWDRNDLQSFLEGLRFSAECSSELSSLLCSNNIYDDLPKHLRVKPGIDSLQWKIDLSLSQSNNEEKLDLQQMKQIMYRDIQIILNIKLTNGHTHTYKLSVLKLHQLRFTIASALKSLIVLEKRKCMRTD